jgi:hypothetical protein
MGCQVFWEAYAGRRGMEEGKGYGMFDFITSHRRKTLKQIQPPESLSNLAQDSDIIDLYNADNALQPT